MGKISRKFNPEECRASAHVITRGRKGTKLVYCKGIRGPLTPDQIRQYAPQFAHLAKY
ncbi:hypothetical protein [Candidatus Methanodesulfokora washburnensis]|uniref:hypothetical protein n=1 Tax=Candidatus Methanodesulfokora washburnensis TaxID=2478471 RepID=UPI001386868D|nr:hypothetical protein [Candidatus Methanodesulfokores washburnensis]